MNTQPLPQETEIPQRHEDTGNRDDLKTDPNSCFSDLSDSLNSLNSVKVHLGNNSNEFTWNSFAENSGETTDEKVSDCTNTPCKYPCNPCILVNRCSNHGKRFSCDCAEGYTGTTCEDENECVSNPCENDGACNDGVKGFSCSCVPGFIRDTCETEKDECTSNPCQNGGTCADGLNSYSCDCRPGFRGPKCQGGMLIIDSFLVTISS